VMGTSVDPIVAAELTCEQPVNRTNKLAPTIATIFFTKTPSQDNLFFNRHHYGV